MVLSRSSTVRGAKRSVSYRSDSFKRAKTLPYSNRRATRIPRQISNGPLFDPTPASIKVRCRYCKQGQLTATSSGNTVYFTMRANSPFDPDEAIGGRKALGFDIYDSLYAKYRVLKSTIELTPINNQNEGIAFIQKNNLTAPLSTSLERTLEKKYTTWVQPSQLRNGGARSLTSTWSMKENPEMNTEDFSSVNSNPEDQVYWIVGYGSHSADALHYIVNITYDVEFSERKTIPST